MKPYCPQTASGYTRAGYDVHHKTSDYGRAGRKRSARVLRRCARREEKEIINAALLEQAELEAELCEQARQDWAEYMNDLYA